MNLIDLGFSSTFIWNLIKKSTTKNKLIKNPSLNFVLCQNSYLFGEHLFNQGISDFYETK